MAAQPRWFQALNDALSLPENKGKIVYQLATTDLHNIPRVRSLQHRDFLIPKGLPSVPIILTTTDIRTPKVPQLLSTPTVEVVWWLDGTQEQFRITGKATVIPSREHPLHRTIDIPHDSALAVLNSEGEESSPGKYDWEKKRREVFDSMNSLRPVWARPPPGTVLESYDDAKAWPVTLPKLAEAETEEDKKNLEIAISNFALLLIEPTVVDWVQLGVKPDRRTKFTKEGQEWTEQILVP
ncbi:unnamed protein product [Somion occarium]|uniref:Pyridoxamine 5'-phosphate oxidase Alr4036 family FMN-binding domain-containing protein n=1 Tax=Somion occarium TaxID=3059160 RepID=A0ABP1CJP9_9APHY